jgi:hypothetical protein
MDGAVVVVCEGGFVRSFSYSGQDLWTYRIRGKFEPFVTRGPDGISWVAEENAGGPRKLIALNRVGRKVSEIAFTEPFTAPPQAGLDGRIFVPFGETVVTYSLHGQKLGTAKNGAASPGGFAPMPVPAYPHVTLSATRAEGRLPGSEWVLDITGAAALPAYNGEGLVVVGGQNWILAAYRVEDAPLQAARLDAEEAHRESIPLLSKRPETYKLAERIAVPVWVSMEGIAAALDQGTVGDNEPVFASFLMNIFQTVVPKPQINDIEERVAALTLLGRLGSPEYMPFLAGVLSHETAPEIKAAAAASIGAIGIDRNGIAINALMNEVLPVFPLSNPSVQNAVVDAAGKLALMNGPPVYPQGAAILGAFSIQKTFPGLQKRAAYWLRQLFAH